jgi:hypothetical protein
MRRIAFTLVPLLLLGCRPEVVAPEADAAVKLTATSTWTRGSFFFDFVFDGSSTCVGEALHGYGEVPYQMHEVLNGHGGYSYFIQFRPQTPKGPRYSLTGVTSGTVWWYKNGLPYNEAFHLGPGQVYRWKAHETYDSDDGSRLFFERVLHLTVNANGELVVDRLDVGPDGTGIRCGSRN